MNEWRFRQCRSLADLGNPSLVRLILFYFYVAVGPASRPMSFLDERYCGVARVPAPNQNVIGKCHRCFDHGFLRGEG